MAKSSSGDCDTIIDEREEVMVSLVGDSQPTLRKAHFLKPTATSFDEPELPLDSQLPLTPTFEPKNWPLKVSFKAWKYNPDGKDDWIIWVTRMQSMHQAEWKRAGIYEAILNSTNCIPRYYDLIFGLSEKWCTNTNTLIFPWGEATITLEDVIVLGGYFALGFPASCSFQNREWKIIEAKLIDARREVAKSYFNHASQTVWMKKFVNSSSEIEHEAFLSLWLSRFVFPSSSLLINKHVFPIAVCLARGVPVALAPAVLASIYRDLSQLKRGIIALAKSSSGVVRDDGSKLELFSPFQLVQIWAWERFPALQPKPNVINFGDSRSAQWNKVKILKIGNVRLALDSAAESFLWRPYAKKLRNWSSPTFYKENEELVPIKSGLGSHFESFARCLRVSKLIGIDCIEQYFPNRVGMQFGMDQDLPGPVDPLDETPEGTRTNYSKPVSDSKLYIPPRLFEADVTTRYLKWWKERVLGQQEPMDGFVQQQRSPDISKCNPLASKEMHMERDPDVLPGFLPKCNMIELGNRVGYKPAVVQMLTCDQQKISSNKLVGNDEILGHGEAVRKMVSVPRSAQVIPGNELKRCVSGRAVEMEAGEKSKAGSTSNSESINGSAGEDNSCTLQIPKLVLETRIRTLEVEVAKLKAARLGHRFE